jgi:divalent metal cation (Fe/Co/Zn/Cd) transporter
MGAVVAATGTLLTAMALHALIDAGTGVITWIALREMRMADEPAPPPPAYAEAAPAPS